MYESMYLFKNMASRAMTRMPHHSKYVLGGSRIRFFGSKAKSVDPSNALKSSLLKSKIARDEMVASGMVDALAASLGKDSPLLRYSILEEDGDLYNKSGNALVVLGEAGLKSLAAAVENEIPEDSSGSVYDVTFVVPHENTEFKLPMRCGQNLMQLAAINQDTLGSYLECACGGNMACASCHVYVDSISFKILLEDDSKKESVDEDEMDMIDLAFLPTEYSRLGCQVTMTKKIGNSMKITIPSGVNNLWK